MLGIITGVGFLIHLYSVGYMAHEDGYWRFFAYLNLFMFFMLVLVLSSQLPSALRRLGRRRPRLLPAHRLLLQADSAANAGKKAFIVNRIGDFGFLLAMFLLIAHFGTLSFDGVFTQIAATPPWRDRRLPHRHRPSARRRSHRQVRADPPLHLAARRDGRPHARLRAHPRRDHGHRRHLHGRALPRPLRPLARSAHRRRLHRRSHALMAATIGMVQHDIKRVLAYSTVSQLGYMFLACGVGAYSAGIFHLMTHAFFKALLFLAAGSPSSTRSGEQDMRVMGGLRKKIPITFWCMTVGRVSPSPACPGSFRLLLQRRDPLPDLHSGTTRLGKLLWFVGLLTALLTSPSTCSACGSKRSSARHASTNKRSSTGVHDTTTWLPFTPRSPITHTMVMLSA